MNWWNRRARLRGIVFHSKLKQLFRRTFYAVFQRLADFLEVRLDVDFFRYDDEVDSRRDFRGNIRPVLVLSDFQQDVGELALLESKRLANDSLPTVAGVSFSDFLRYAQAQARVSQIVPCRIHKQNAVVIRRLDAVYSRKIQLTPDVLRFRKGIIGSHVYSCELRGGEAPLPVRATARYVL